MDGIELVEQLSRQPHIPSLLLISGHSPELLANSVRAAQELGFTGIGHLAKPIDDNLFLTEITRLLDSLGIDVNVVAPLGASVDDLRRRVPQR